MARPLTPISKEKVKEYEENIRNAKDKAEKRKWKRLFLEYIKKRDMEITDFENEPIYLYYAKTPRIEVLKKEIENDRKSQKKLLESFIIRSFNKSMGGDYTDILNDYFEGKAGYFDNDTKKMIEDFIEKEKKVIMITII